MAALKGKAIERFIAARDPKTPAILIYGRDAGLVKDRGDRLAKSVTPDFKDPFNYISLTDADLKQDPARLADEASALSFAGGERVVRLSTVGDASSGSVKALIDGLDGGYVKANAVIIVEAGDLAKGSKVRKMFEAAKSAVAIPCYEDTPADVRDLASGRAQEEGLRFEPDALDLAALYLGADRGVSLVELEKLFLYKGPKDARDDDVISIDDVRACLIDTIDGAMDDVSAAALDGDAARLALSLHRFAGSGGSAIGLLRALQRSAMRLRQAQAYLDQGMSPPEAMKKLRPPVFYMEQRPFTARLRAWRPASLETVLSLLLTAECDAKRTGAPQREIVERAAFQIAAMGGRRR